MLLPLFSSIPQKDLFIGVRIGRCNFSRFIDPAVFCDFPVSFSVFVHLFDYFLAQYDSSEDNMFSIQPISLTSSNKELTSICILFTAIRHAQPIRNVMLVVKVLIVEVIPVDTFSSRTVSVGDISCLYHKSRNNSMKNVPLVVKILPTLTFSLFTSTKAPKVFCGLRDVVK